MVTIWEAELYNLILILQSLTIILAISTPSDQPLTNHLTSILAPFFITPTHLQVLEAAQDLGGDGGDTDGGGVLMPICPGLGGRRGVEIRLSERVGAQEVVL